MSNTIVYDGKTAANWARELGLSHEAIRKRVGRLGSLEEAVAIGPNKRPRATHVGKECADWARQLGITRQAMHKRIAQWGSLEAAVGRGGPRQMRKKPKKYKSKHTHVGKTIAEWAHELGISAAALYHRIARLGSLDAAVAMGGRNKPGRKRKEADLVLHAQIVQRIQDGIAKAKCKGVAFNSLVYWPMHCETLFSVRGRADDAWAIGVIALRAFRAAGLDAVIRMYIAGTYCEATIERAQPVAITEEVHDDPS